MLEYSYIHCVLYIVYTKFHIYTFSKYICKWVEANAVQMKHAVNNSSFEYAAF